MYSFPDLQPVHVQLWLLLLDLHTDFSEGRSGGGLVVPSFQNFPQVIMIHTVKGFGVINKVEVDVPLELSCFFYELSDVGNLISGSSAFPKSSLKNCQVVQPSKRLWRICGLILNVIFAPPTSLLGLLLCPWTWGIFFCWDPTFCQQLFSSELLNNCQQW